MEDAPFRETQTALLPGGGFVEEKLHSPASALATFFARVAIEPPRIERVGLADAFGRVLAERVDADDDYPNAARSAMDGFALAAATTPGEFRIAGEISMGRVWPGVVAKGTAVRIPTGGAIPEGADAVVPIEDVSIAGDHLEVGAAVAVGDCVNPQGGDMRRGEAVLAPGRRIGASELGVLATLGVARVPVYRRPVVAVLSSGDELVPVDSTPSSGAIRDSNRYAVAGALQAMGAIAHHYPTVPDEPGALEAALRTALAGCDGAIVTGGSSVGERDLTPGAIAALGPPGIIVHGLRIKPGKPTVLAAVRGKPVIGLPGNPTSASIVLQAVVAPIIAAIVGAPLPVVRIEATLTAPAHSRAGWTWFVPVALENEAAGATAHPLPLRSSAVSLTARASGYVIMDESVETLDTGTLVCVHRFL